MYWFIIWMVPEIQEIVQPSTHTLESKKDYTFKVFELT